MSSDTPVWFITAASSGFGKEIALNALKKGHRVVATGRTVSKLDQVKQAGAEVLQLDVTADLESIKKVAAEAHAKYGRIDILLNSAGYILEGAVEECSPQETLDMFNTNVFGSLNVARAVLPYMRERRSGVVANFGSVGSWHGGPAYGTYAATKWACSGISESMRAELAPLGVTVTVIEPGYFRSGFLNPGARIISAQKFQDYDDTAVGQVRKMLDKVNNNQPGDVSKGSDVIVDVLSRSGVAKGREIPIRLVLGSDCLAGIKDKCTDTLKLLDEWKDIIVSTDYPEGQ